MGTTLATYYAKLQDMPDSEYKGEILEGIWFATSVPA